MDIDNPITPPDVVLSLPVPGIIHSLASPLYHANASRNGEFDLDFDFSECDWAGFADSPKPHSIPFDVRTDCSSLLCPTSAEGRTRDNMQVDSALEDDTLIPVLPILQEGVKRSLGSPEVPQTPPTVSESLEGTQDVSPHQKVKSSNAANASPRLPHHNETPVPNTPSLYDPSPSSTTPETENPDYRRIRLQRYSFNRFDQFGLRNASQSRKPLLRATHNFTPR